MTTTTRPSEYIQNLERRLQALEGELRRLEAEASKSMSGQSPKLVQLKKTLEEKRRDFRAKLATAQRSSETAWKEMQAGLNSAWTELSEAFERAKHEFTAHKDQSAIASK